MPDRELIHSLSDVASTLLYALDLGFQVRLDDPQPEPRPRLLSRSEISRIERGVFVLFRSEWMHGQLQIMPISSGHNSGKFFVSPSVNYSGITVYFSGERLDQGRRRLGDCMVSFDREWLELPAKVMKPTPPEVGVFFRKLLRHMSSRVVIKAGVHRYEICRGVIGDPAIGRCLPPFDFIPWDIGLFHGIDEVSSRERGGPGKSD
jgi:hypothetical protein